jgi:hypothetical protein
LDDAFQAELLDARDETLRSLDDDAERAPVLTVPDAGGAAPKSLGLHDQRYPVGALGRPADGSVEEQRLKFDVFFELVFGRVGCGIVLSPSRCLAVRCNIAQPPHAVRS